MNKIVLSIVALLFVVGCENQYTIVTTEGLVDMPLSKAIKEADSEAELWNLYSKAISEEDKIEIEKAITKRYGKITPYLEDRELDRSKIVEDQNKRRISYVKSHILDDKTKELILMGSYDKGMTKEQFIASRGKPTKTEIVTGDDGERVEILTEGMFSEKRYYFSDGVLNFWE